MSAIKHGAFVFMKDKGHHKSRPTYTVRLVEHNYNNRIHSLPGGGISSGELPIDAAIREIFEETGIHCQKRDLHYVGIFLLSKDYGLVSLYYTDVRYFEDLTKVDPSEIASIGLIPLEVVRLWTYPTIGETQSDLIEIGSRFHKGDRPLEGWPDYIIERRRARGVL